MKISLVIESDNMEELVDGLIMLSGNGPAALTTKEVAKIVDKLQVEAAQPPKPKPQPKPTEPKPTEPDEPQPAAVVAEEPALQGAEVQEKPKEAKKGRGRPRRETTEQPPAGTAATAQVNGGVEDMRANLMKVFAGYVQKYGTNFGYGDVSKLLQDNFGPDVRKSSDVTDDNLVKAVLVVQSAIDANPYGRKVAGAQ
jgi:hypothetical protein